jgi:hypothetical protein
MAGLPWWTSGLMPAPCELATKSFEEIRAFVDQGYSVTAKCEQTLDWHRCVSYFNWCSSDRSLIQRIFNYHSMEAVDDFFLEQFNIEKFKNTLAFVKTLTEKWIVFRSSGMTLITEDVLYFKLPVSLRKLYLYRETLKYAIDQGLFHGTEVEIITFFRMEVLKAIQEIEFKTETKRDFSIFGPGGYATKTVTTKVTVFTNEQIQKLHYLKETIIFLQNILIFRETLFGRLLDRLKYDLIH